MIGALAVILLFSGPAVAESKEAAAVGAAKKWLALVDAGRYAESWDTAAELFRAAVPKDKWVEQVGAVRGPLCALKQRTVKSEKYTTSLPGAPDGEYVVIQFRTSFADKKGAVETITPMLGKDGKWHVSGYYIH